MIAKTADVTGSRVGPHRDGAKRSAGRLLSLAAAPTFAAMAVLSGIHDAAAPAMLCAALRDASPLTGMTAMYVLMGAFHLAPWLELIRVRPTLAPNRSGGGIRHRSRP